MSETAVQHDGPNQGGSPEGEEGYNSSTSTESEGFADALDELALEASLGADGVAGKQTCDSQVNSDSQNKPTFPSCDTSPEANGDNLGDGDDGSEEESPEVEIDEEAMRERESHMTEEEKEEKLEEAKKMKAEGNQLFGAMKFDEAIVVYSNALQVCPLAYEKDRAMIYSNRGACKIKLEKFEKALEDCSKALELDPNYMKCLCRRADIHMQLDKLDEALVDYKKIMEMDPANNVARQACMTLPDRIKERNEKMKEEMMGKLKDLGNMVLRPFGLSTNNFKLQQDPNTGGYSVQFQQGEKNSWHLAG